MGPKALAKRYQYLWSGEAFSLVMFNGFLVRGILQDPVWTNWIVRTYGLLIVNGILLQGIYWWLLKARLLRNGRKSVPSQTARRYGTLRWVNWAAIALLPIVLYGKQRLTGQLGSSKDTMYGLLIWGGAILEQVNYYYYQLMYDNRYDWYYLRTRKRLRPGNIPLTLRRSAP